MISYWKKTEEIYHDDGLTLIIGWYDHKHEHDGGFKSLGVHWGNYPKSRGILSPCVIPEITRNSMLAGLLHKAITDGNHEEKKALSKAIEFFAS
ncbi:hypothetical protein M3923_003368 [Vibrio metschnikovii]|jgi:hypothetical protein|nr:hypothetical protein [Vibrio parahaemolyticus]EKO3674632.1 hypothetical protein [Vibrio metschnikovii]EKO3698686.1 hypothetical protein [Vibrio metschnikovii]EKO3722553.1 hypothetical protein [Vibrio metschnikovii]HBN6297060.1 hypothetical protein [Vibrio parahaemolyticus]